MDKTPHERLLQLLSAFLIELNTLQRQTQLEADAAAMQTMLRGGLDNLTSLARDALAIARETVEEEWPVALAGLTLPDALTHLVEESAERLGISSRIAISGVDDKGHPRDQGHLLTATAERLLLFLAREILYEVEQRHGVRRLRLTFAYGNDEVQFALEDDGLNTPLPSPEEAPQTLPPPFNTLPAALEDNDAFASDGLAMTPLSQHLRLRFSQIGGELDIQSLGERGRRVQARLPYATNTWSQLHEEIPLVVPAPLPQNVPVTRQNIATSTPTIRVLIVESQTVTRAGLRRLLEGYPELQVVGEAVDGVQAASETVELGPQVVLMDAELPEGQTLSTLRQLKQLNPDTHILLLATQDREEYLYETLRAGADGYILKDIDPDELVRAIRTIARGEVLIQPQIAGRLLSRYGRQGRNNRFDVLTTRELEVLRLLARGLRNKEIASRLYVSERTVNFHLANIYQKLNVSGRTEALSKALEQGLITP